MDLPPDNKVTRGRLLSGLSTRGRADAMDLNANAAFKNIDARFHADGSTDLIVIRVDPFRRAVFANTIRIGFKHSDKQVRRLLQCSKHKIGTQEIGVSVDDEGKRVPLVAAGRIGVSSATKGWYLENGEMRSPVHAGIGVIFARGAIDGGMIPLPPEVTVDWVKEHVRWHDGIDETAPGGSGDLAQEWVDREQGAFPQESGREAADPVSERDGDG